VRDPVPFVHGNTPGARALRELPAEAALADPGLRDDPEHLALLALCRLPAGVADLAADLDLPLGVIQIFLADLRARGLITVHNPTPPAQLPDPQILREVADGLRRL